MRGFIQAPMWAMIGGVLCGLAILVIANGCRQGATAPIKNGQHYAGKGFAIDFPQQWTVKEVAPAAVTPATTNPATSGTVTTPVTEEAKQASGPVVSATNPGGAENIVVEVEELSYDVPLDEYAMFCREKIARAINGYKDVEALADFNGKQPGKVLVYSGEKDGVTFQASAYFFIKGKTGYLVNAYTSTANFNKHQNTFGQVAASMALN